QMLIQARTVSFGQVRRSMINAGRSHPAHPHVELVPISRRHTIDRVDQVKGKPIYQGACGLPTANPHRPVRIPWLPIAVFVGK
ncbi:MAG: hypothetical protein JW797_08935, partial [Bradymonadales bacterium]|nr:hypothetical protein [Bradymonadales bacterium]